MSTLPVPKNLQKLADVSRYFGGAFTSGKWFTSHDFLFRRHFAAPTANISIEVNLPPLNHIRNFGISAHVDSGKTTLTERILYYTGRIDAIHEIQGSDGVGAKMDSMELEKEKGITIQSAATYANWYFDSQRHHFNIIDTPGHIDFQIEVERALRVLDGAVFVVCSANGVQSQTFTVDRQMRRYKLPRFIFLNKLDKSTADPFEAVEDIRDKLKIRVAPLQVPIGVGKDFQGLIDVIKQQACRYEGRHGELRTTISIPDTLKDQAQQTRTTLIETLLDIDEDLAELYVERGEDGCTAEALHAAIRRVTIKRTFVPVLMGSAKGNKGVQDVLDAVCLYLPDAGELPFDALKPNNDRVSLATDHKAELLAMVFKLQESQFGHLAYAKIYQGMLRKGQSAIDADTKKKVTWRRIYRMHSNEAKEITQARAGDIVTLTGIDVKSGTTLAADGVNLSLMRMFVPEPVISVSAKVGAGSDAMKFTKALDRFQKEDPTFIVTVDPESKQYILSGMGELHLDIYIERIRREYGIEVKTETPRVNLREVVSGGSEVDFTHKRQTGGRGEWARIYGTFEAIDPSLKTMPEPVFVNDQLSQDIPHSFITSLKKGFKAALAEGPMTGYPVLNVKFTLMGGETHEVDSSDQAFKTCIRKCVELSRPAVSVAYNLMGRNIYYNFYHPRRIREYYQRLKPVVMEPRMYVEVVTPKEHLKSVTLNVSELEFEILSTSEDEESTTIYGEAPLRAMFGFSTVLRQASRGQAEFSMQFDRYQVMDGRALDCALDSYQERLRLKKAKV